jgi:hypothetical protein
MIVAADDRRRAINQKEGKPVAEEETAERCSVPETAEQPSVLVNEAVIVAADASEEGKTPNQGEAESLAEEDTAEQCSVPETPEQPSELETRA